MEMQMNEWDEQEKEPGDEDDDHRNRRREEASGDVDGSFDFRLDKIRLMISFRMALLLIGVGSVAVMTWLARVIHDILQFITDSRK